MSIVRIISSPKFITCCFLHDMCLIFSIISHCITTQSFILSHKNCKILTQSLNKHTTKNTVKVYASWCKTCQVFDVRYRKLASQLGDKHDSSGTQILQKGRARFAEMQYDNPNNEEMCKLLNATKLPHIIMYKVILILYGPGLFLLSATIII